MHGVHADVEGTQNTGRVHKDGDPCHDWQAQKNHDDFPVPAPFRFSPGEESTEHAEQGEVSVATAALMHDVANWLGEESPLPIQCLDWTAQETCGQMGRATGKGPKLDLRKRPRRRLQNAARQENRKELNVQGGLLADAGRLAHSQMLGQQDFAVCP